jgi:ribosomal protein S27E
MLDDGRRFVPEARTGTQVRPAFTLECRACDLTTHIFGLPDRPRCLTCGGPVLIVPIGRLVQIPGERDVFVPEESIQ